MVTLRRNCPQGNKVVEMFWRQSGKKTVNAGEATENEMNVCDIVSLCWREYSVVRYSY